MTERQWWINRVVEIVSTCCEKNGISVLMALDDGSGSVKTLMQSGGGYPDPDKHILLTAVMAQAAMNMYCGKDDETRPMPKRTTKLFCNTLCELIDVLEQDNRQSRFRQ